MSNQAEHELLKCLKTELGKCKEQMPAMSQDTTFLENLEEIKADGNEYFAVAPQKNEKQFSYWSVAIMAVLALGLVTTFVLTKQVEHKTNTEIVSNYISQSNKIELTLTRYDKEELSSHQYTEVLMLRNEISYIDDALNHLYMSGKATSQQQLSDLWYKRLEKVRDLKSVYLRSYTVARI